MTLPDLSNIDGMRDLVGLMNDPSRVADLLLEDHPETGDSPAKIMADIINTTRADNRRIGQALGVEIEAKLMTPERAADLLAGMVDGGAVDLVVLFNDLAEQRDEILRAALEPDEYEAFCDQKQQIMNHSA